MKKHLYDYDKKFKRQLEIMESSRMSKRNKKLVLKFCDYQAARDISTPRMIRVVGTLRQVAVEIKKDFDKLTKGDYEKFFASMKKRDYAPDSIETYKSTVKVFHKWLDGDEKYPKCVSWIKRNSSNRHRKLPEDMLTQDDVKELIKHAKTKRDKALIASLWESGTRIGELGTLEIKNVAFDKFGCHILVDGKTGMRRVRLVNSAPYLLEWVNSHPKNKDRNGPLWVNLKYNKMQRMGHRNIMKTIQDAARHAGIEKPVNPHHFRHSRATYMANHLTEAQMKEYFGWVQDSDMAARYVHLSGKQVDDAVLRMHGLKQEDKQEDVLKREPCPRCKELNDVNNEYCNKCWLSLTPEASVELQEMGERDSEGMLSIMELLRYAQSNPKKVRQAIAVMQKE